MNGEWLGVILSVAFLGPIIGLFHHYSVRISNARDWLSRGAILVDVDDAAEFASRHPRLAVSIPFEELGMRAHELGDKDTPLVVFAHSWRRGAQAASELRGMGFWEVLNAGGVRTKERLSAEVALVAEKRDIPTDELIELAPEES